MREPRGQRWDELYQSWYSWSYSENFKFRFSVYQSDPLSLYELDLFVLFLFLSLSKYHCYKICLICVTIQIITKSFLWVISESSLSYSELATTIYYLFDLLHISQTSEHIRAYRTSDLIGHTLEHYDFIVSQVATRHISGELTVTCYVGFRNEADCSRQKWDRCREQEWDFGFNLCVVAM